jgi:hypothetical protein
LFDDSKKKHAATFFFCTSSTKDFLATRTFYRSSPPAIGKDGKSSAPGRFVNDLGMPIVVFGGAFAMVMAIVL